MGTPRACTTDATPPDDFDWVDARFRCSVAGAFLDLRKAARRDTDTRNRLEKTTKFEFTSGGDTEFTVTRYGRHEASVRFSRTANPPRVRIDGYRIPQGLEIGTALNGSGECELVLVANRSPIPRWRILNLALDALFFDDKTDQPR